MRNMSFMLTTEQIRNQTKTVTRRLGWWFLKPGDRVMACVKCQGIPKGGTIEKICEIEIVSIKKVFLFDMDSGEAALEGFPHMWGSQFVTMFCKEMRCKRTVDVNRIEFKYVAGPGR